MNHQIDWFGRLMLVFAGILGTAGVVAAAAASHWGDERVLGAVSLIALTQAAASLAFGLIAPKGRFLRAGAIAIGAGACLFSLSLASQQTMSIVLPMTAPIGGTAIIIGWLLIAIVGLIARR